MEWRVGSERLTDGHFHFSTLYFDVKKYFGAASLNFLLIGGNGS